MNLTGFFWLTQRAIAEMLKRGGGHVVNITTTLLDYANSSTPSLLTSLTKGEHYMQTGAEGSAHAVEHVRQTEVHA